MTWTLQLSGDESVYTCQQLLFDDSKRGRGDVSCSCRSARLWEGVQVKQSVDGHRVDESKVSAVYFICIARRSVLAFPPASQEAYMFWKGVWSGYNTSISSRGIKCELEVT